MRTSASCGRWAMRGSRCSTGRRGECWSPGVSRGMAVSWGSMNTSKLARQTAAARDGRSCRIDVRPDTVAASRTTRCAMAKQKSGKGAGEDTRKHRAVQAGLRKEPTDLPAQHIPKPGNEHALELAPRFLA